MTTTIPEPFTLDHLLLCGQIIDRGQLSSARRVELDRRAALGELTKMLCWREQEKSFVWCWKVKGVQVG